MPTPEQQDFVERITRFIAADPRFVGLTIGGSWRDGQLDQWSDLDLVLVVYPDYHFEIMRERQRLAHGLGQLLSSFTGEHIGDARVLICLYDKPLLHVDLKFVTPLEFEERVEDPVVLFEREGQLSEILGRTFGAYPLPNLQWIEDRFWIWVHYAALRLGRGELLELLDHISYIRNSVLGSLLLVHQGHAPRRVRRAEQLLSPEALRKLCRTVAPYDRKAIIAALWATIELYRELREEDTSMDLLLRSQAEQRSVEFLQTVIAQTGQ